MLRSFRFANHRSFRDEQEFVLLPVYDKTRHVIPVAGLYGANASGKSNVLDALSFMRHSVLESYSRWEPDGGVPRTPFRLDPEAAGEPSSYVVDVLIDGVRHVYGFAVDDERVREEWLYSYPQGRRRVLFDRTADKVEFGSSVTGPKSAVEELTRPNALLLSLAARVEMPMLRPMERWFRGSIQFVRPGAMPQVPRADVVSKALETNPRRARQFRELVQAADIGVSDFVIEPTGKPHPYLDFSVDTIRRRLADAEDRLASLLAEGERDGMTPTHSNAIKKAQEAVSAERGMLAFYMEVMAANDTELRLVHGDAGSFPMADESRGTQVWLGHVWAALRAIDAGSVVVVDELDSSLHPLLTGRLVGLFQSAETNPKGAQLVFTAHDTSLLGTALDRGLERDQVWFVEKSRAGISTLFSLPEFHPRKGENPERRYLGGAYGAVPVLTESQFVDAVTGGERAEG